MSPELDLLAAVLGLIDARLPDHPGPFVLSVSGSQGSGKSTLAKAVAADLRSRGVASEVLSIDDLYLSSAARRKLAAEVHPLLATRGVPGTHDVGLGLSVFAALDAGEPVRLPRFDKASDDLRGQAEWPEVSALRVLVFEGWCVGAGPQPDSSLTVPVNVLEADEDPDGAWRSFVNTQLGLAYQELFARIDAQVFLAAPAFSVVKDWRLQQELEIAGQGQAVMDEAGIARFVQFYQRLTEWMIEDIPHRADLTARIDQNRRVLSIT
ncbi:kinase [Novosphingobium sp.]|uniref:kinase n=1 Tax=Novosphingobium sp. TaxID=1874826 RepID=UPI00286E9903|nr:kinase [Novosphingobium sp.]